MIKVNQFKLQRKADIDMTLASFCELYEMDVKPKLKLSTWLTKESMSMTVLKCKKKAFEFCKFFDAS